MRAGRARRARTVRTGRAGGTPAGRRAGAGPGANNYVVGQISRTVFSEVRASASADTARSFLD
ncbi:hypothetical protein, partial [Streptomyces sp. NPDC048845]|uniref:hypothetical protein n=1 Tax=Streptomyces sp. NPDC048845 TaxID=3155390 RepID=UPI00343D23C1